MPSGTNPLTGDGIAVMSLRFTLPSGQPAENVLGIHKDTGGEFTDTELTDIATTAKAWWESGDGTHSYRAKQSTACTLDSIFVRSLHTRSSPEIDLSVGEAGTDAGDHIPNGMTFTCTLRTGLAGRSHRGRLYACGLTKNFLNTDPNLADLTHVNDLVAAVKGWISGPHQSPGGYSPSILSRSNNGVYRANIASYNIADVGYFDLNMDYQRRRAPGHNRGG